MFSYHYAYKDSSDEAAEQIVASESLNFDAPNAECSTCDADRDADCDANEPSSGEARSLGLLRRLGVGVVAPARLRLLLSVDESASADCKDVLAYRSSSSWLKVLAGQSASSKLNGSPTGSVGVVMGVGM